MKTNTISKVLCGAVFAISAGLSMAVSAGNYSETVVTTSAEGLRTTTVSYADLDLASTQGKEALEHRVSKAAREVCGSSHFREAGSVSRAVENKSCYENAMAQAMKKVSSPQVASIAY
jgi:UrcA family protein